MLMKREAGASREDLGMHWRMMRRLHGLITMANSHCQSVLRGRTLLESPLFLMHMPLVTMIPLLSAKLQLSQGSYQRRNSFLC